jgi:hypothetical protein
MLWEPTLARVGADIAKYPPDALGTIKRPWGGDKNGMDRTLCVTSPVVQEHYRNMVKKFVRQYPDVEGFLFYNLDGDSWLCTPQLCPRCQLVCTDSPPDTFHPWETQALFTDLLARAAREERSDFEFIHWVSHFEGHAAERLVRTSREYSALAYGVRVGDHDVMIADTVVPSGSEFLMLQKVCAEKSVPFFVTFSSNTHEVIPNGFPFPFHIAAALKKLHTWNVRAISGCGPIPYFNQIDALVEKEFLWNPEQNPETFLVDLSVRQFGKEAGKLMYEAWEEIKTGMDVWKDTINHPFLGSHTPTSLGFSYFTYAKAILPEIANEYEKGSLFLGGSANASDSAERFHSMGVHLAKAAALAKQAVEKAAANEPIGVAYFEGDATPTMKEYAELNYAPIAIADVYCRLRYNIFASLVLLKGMERDTTDRNSMAARGKEVLYHDLIREDIAVRKRFVELLKKFSRMRPCLTRTSLSEEGIAHQIAYMNSEIGKMENYLVVVDTTEEFK